MGKKPGKSKNYFFERNALLGFKPRTYPRPALTTANTFSSVVLVGDAQIIGDAYLSEYGLKAGNMGGSYFTGRQLIEGSLKVNEDDLPKLSRDVENNLRDWVRTRFPEVTDQVVTLMKGSQINSFKNPTQWILDERPIFLNDSMVGNMVVKSDTKIVVSERSVLDRIILIAPEIEVETNFHGNFQAFASRSIVINENVSLDYPSALVLIPKTPQKQTTSNDMDKEFNSIQILGHSIVKGSLIYLAEEANGNHEPEVLLERDSQVLGEIYCEQNLELKGLVTGSVHTHAFVARAFGSIYRNHIYNGQINVLDLPEEFLGVALGTDHKKGVAKWVY